jgi:hypothetical protein
MTAVSTFTWLDHRDEDQQRVREALAAFDQPGIVDPLGFGVVRDVFSDLLFPGVSTVQTRARYFLLVPWAYRRLDRERVSPRDGARRARELELATIEALLRGSEDKGGVIGQNSRASTKQLPSFIYWGGLGRWGIRRFPGTRQEYVATLGQRRRMRVADEDAGPGDPWPGLPEEPPGVFEETTLRLPVDEAEFLRNRAMLATRGTYLELLLRDGHRDQHADVPWLHPLAGEAPAGIRTTLHHARLFAHAAWGADLLYNASLSEMLEADGQAPLAAPYARWLDDWVDEVEGLGGEFHSWDRGEFWAHVERQNPRAVHTRAFVDWWLALVTSDPRGAIASTDVRRRLRDRETRIKGARAKLANRGARERSPGAQGGELMRFRWLQAQQIIDDIHAGLAADA